MSLSTERIAPCELCGHHAADPGGRTQHFTSVHVEPAIQHRNGEYYWECPSCGVSDGSWFRETAASTAMAHHLQRRHGVTPP